MWCGVGWGKCYAAVVHSEFVRLGARICVGLGAARGALVRFCPAFLVSASAPPFRTLSSLHTPLSVLYPPSYFIHDGTLVPALWGVCVCVEATHAFARVCVLIP